MCFPIHDKEKKRSTLGMQLLEPIASHHFARDEISIPILLPYRKSISLVVHTSRSLAISAILCSREIFSEHITSDSVVATSEGMFSSYGTYYGSI